MPCFQPICLALLLAVLAVAIAGCSNRQVYEAIQHSNQQECQKNPKHTREKCMRQVSDPYEKYEAERQATIEDRGEGSE